MYGLIRDIKNVWFCVNYNNWKRFCEIKSMVIL